MVRLHPVLIGLGLADQRRRARAHLRADAGAGVVPGQLAGVRLHQTRRGPVAPVSHACPTPTCASAWAAVSACPPPTRPIGSARPWCCWFIIAARLVHAAAGVLVGFSRIYNGVHYPSDVLAGALLGAGYSAAVIWGSDALWQWIGPRWFPLWWERMPSVLNPVARRGRRARLTRPLMMRNGCAWVTC